MIRAWIVLASLLASAVRANSSLDSVHDLRDLVYSNRPSGGAFITTEKRAHLAGLRLESDAPRGIKFFGYTSRGVSLVRPGVQVKVVLFGWWLDEVEAVLFAPDRTCTARTHEQLVNSVEFNVRTEKRIIFNYVFETLPEQQDVYWLCVQLTSSHAAFTLVDDLQMAVTTRVPPRAYYFPPAWQVGFIGCLLALSALFSGLNLGLMALSPQELNLILKSGSKQERRYAEVVLPVRRTGNQLLCSLLIGNVCVNSAISILFDDLTSGYVALIVASAGIVVFGEICPQALCVKKGLEVGARTIWLTRFFMCLTFPLAYPIGRALDWCLGKEVVSYDRKRLMELIKMTHRHEEGLADELKIAVGAMEIADKTVGDVMTKVDDVFMLSDTTVLNTKTVTEILRMGYTRVPVYSGDRNNVVALLFVKDLALLDPDDNFTIKTVCSYHDHQLRFVQEETPLRVMLEEFKRGDYHLAVVQRRAGLTDEQGKAGTEVASLELVGVVTLEDIVEEILQAEIVDETDAITDNVHKTRRRRAQYHDYTNAPESDADACVISMQMQLVTMQWLATNHRVFGENFIGTDVLEKVIRQNVHKVEITNVNDAANQVIPSHARLYTKRELSDKFVLILEGRVEVTIGATNMTFEAGPWQSFGCELLDRLERLVTEDRPRVTSRTPGGPLGVLSPTPLAEPDPKKLMFQPDYSVVVKDQCTFLEVTPQVYLLAFKSTLMNRNLREASDSSGPREARLDTLNGDIRKAASELALGGEGKESGGGEQGSPRPCQQLGEKLIKRLKKMDTRQRLVAARSAENNHPTDSLHSPVASPASGTSSSRNLTSP